MSIVYMIVGIACILYYVILAIYAGPAFNFGWFWIALGGAFVVIGLMGRYPDMPAVVWARRILLVIVLAGILLLGITSIFVVKGMVEPEPERIDYAVILGAQVRGSNPSRALLKRLKKAMEVAEKYPQVTLILSGGQGSGEDISEAQCMYDYLTQNGVDESRLVLEDKSTTTRENLIFSDKLTGCSKKDCGIISNDFHICRALLIADKVGYEKPCGLPGEGDPIIELHYIVREATALIIGKLRRQF